MASKGLWGQCVRQPSPQLLTVEGVELREFLRKVAEKEGLTEANLENGYAWCRDQIYAYWAYLRARENDIPSEDARSYLTNACKTEVYVTYNWRMWRHVIGHPKCGRATTPNGRSRASSWPRCASSSRRSR
jgi:thymidylate synthase ThyX